jgi:hypothetical protein
MSRELPTMSEEQIGEVLCRIPACPAQDVTAAWLQMFARAVAEEAVRLERERLGLPKSYGGSTFASWGDQKEGCTVRLHFKDAKEAEQWFNRLTDGWDAIRARSQEGQG